MENTVIRMNRPDPPMFLAYDFTDMPKHFSSQNKNRPVGGSMYILFAGQEKPCHPQLYYISIFG
jgi:hypothetical protein